MRDLDVRLFALVAPSLLLGTLLSGCMAVVCGPTEYHLSGVTASARFEDEPWDAER